MPGNILWSAYAAAIANGLTTELNSLADGSVTALGSQIDNTSSLYEFMDVQLDLASLTISSTSAYVTVFVVPSVDGTNYPDFTSGTYANYHGGYAVCNIPVKNVSATTARAMAVMIPIPPAKFKLAIRSGLGVSMAASGNTLGYRLYANSYT